MELTKSQTVKATAALLFLAAISQPIYTLLYIKAKHIDRLFLWGLEGLIFVLMMAFAGAALVMAKRYSLGFAAIAFSAVLNVVQVGIGLTQFGPFRAAAAEIAALDEVASSVTALSFFLYNAAKILLGLAAMVFGLAKMSGAGIGKAIGGLAVLVGAVALISNTLVMMFGIQSGIVPRPVAGGSGVAATLLLALCLFSLSLED